IGVRIFLKQYQLSVESRYEANHDTLTGIPNRHLFRERFNQILSLAKRNKGKFAIAYVDLDHFKQINDQYQHATGDLVLQEATSRMLACVRDSDTLARIGGDEFLVLLSSIDSEEDAKVVAEKIRDDLIKPFFIHDHYLKIGASVGIAIYPDHGLDEEALVSNADKAMYFAKTHGRNKIQFFDSKLLNPS
ncbi:MAG: GGDEF domain-containing protein, partial [Polynucleobacter sp.]|nr:GGDEF domain-containing protein [Polynucleobacter sp.]